MPKQHDPLADLDVILTDVYTCERSWDAWQYSTMSEHDFTPAAETEVRAELLAWRDAAATTQTPASRVKITVTLDCGHVLTYMDEISEKYPFWCEECDSERRLGKYPWKLTTEIVATGPTVIKPHDEGSSYCTSLPLHDHDRPGETCPAYRTDDNGDRWPCIQPWIHNYPDGVAQRVHRDQFGNEFRVARCQAPAEHGMPHCWCAVAEHHKPLAEPEPGPCRCGHLHRVHNALMSGETRGYCTECGAGECRRYGTADQEPELPKCYVSPCAGEGPHQPCGRPELCDCDCHASTWRALDVAAGAPLERPARPVFEVVHAESPPVWQLACGCAVESRTLWAGQAVWCSLHGQTLVEDAPKLESAARTYLLGCGCQVTPANGAVVGAPYYCAVHGDTTVTMVIPLPAATPEASS